jgi:hypothetical protein
MSRRRPRGQAEQSADIAATVADLRAVADSLNHVTGQLALMIPDTGGREPTTEYGRQLVDQARLLYAAYGCPPKGTPHA